MKKKIKPKDYYGQDAGVEAGAAVEFSDDQGKTWTLGVVSEVPSVNLSPGWGPVIKVGTEMYWRKPGVHANRWRIPELVPMNTVLDIKVGEEVAISTNEGESWKTAVVTEIPSQLYSQNWGPVIKVDSQVYFYSGAAYRWRKLIKPMNSEEPNKPKVGDPVLVSRDGGKTWTAAVVETIWPNLSGPIPGFCISVGGGYYYYVGKHGSYSVWKPNPGQLQSETVVELDDEKTTKEPAPAPGEKLNVLRWAYAIVAKSMEDNGLPIAAKSIRSTIGLSSEEADKLILLDTSNTTILIHPAKK